MAFVNCKKFNDEVDALNKRIDEIKVEDDILSDELKRNISSSYNQVAANALKALTDVSKKQGKLLGCDGKELPEHSKVALCDDVDALSKDVSSLDKEVDYLIERVKLLSSQLQEVKFTDVIPDTLKLDVQDHWGKVKEKMALVDSIVSELDALTSGVYHILDTYQDCNGDEIKTAIVSCETFSKYKAEVGKQIKALQSSAGNTSELTKNVTNLQTSLRNLTSTVNTLSTNFNNLKKQFDDHNVAASETRQGHIRLATKDEALAGTNPYHAITPKTLKDVISTIDVKHREIRAFIKGLYHYSTANPLRYNHNGAEYTGNEKDYKDYIVRITVSEFDRVDYERTGWRNISLFLDTTSDSDLKNNDISAIFILGDNVYTNFQSNNLLGTTYPYGNGVATNLTAGGHLRKYNINLENHHPVHFDILIRYHKKHSGLKDGSTKDYKKLGLKLTLGSSGYTNTKFFTNTHYTTT